MKKGCYLGLALLIGALAAAPAPAHYGMIISSDSMVMQNDHKTVRLTLSFSHPFEGIGMKMDKPGVFSVATGGKTQNLLETLQKTTVMDHLAWTADYTVKRPGACVFYMEPAPYWESAEDCYIIHYTKTVVAAFGDDEGWDEPLGLKTEILPLSKPFGLYAGNVFQGVVLLDGKPVAGAEVEVEYYNVDKKAAAPTDYMITQTIKADGNGVFTYAVPHAGWWGFAALNPSEEKIRHEGVDKDVELGAVLWVEFHPWMTRK